MSHVVITLDTSAPQLTWGAVGDATAGALLEVAYTLDEPALIAATLTLIDGHELELEVLEDRVRVLLPPDAAGGLAQLRALVRDEVGNEATAELTLAISGVPYVPPEPPPPRPRMGGLPTPRRRSPRPSPRTVRARSRTRIGAAASTATVVSRSTVHGSRSAARLAGSPAGHTLVPVRARALVREHRATALAVPVRSRASVRRRDGGDEEALLLDLW